MKDLEHRKKNAFTLIDTDNSVAMARGKGRGAMWRWAKGGEIGTSVIVSTIKIK